LIAHESEPGVGDPPAAGSDAVVAQARASYLAAVLRPDAQRAMAVVEAGLAAGISVDAIYLEVLTPAMHDIGVLWERAQVTVGGERLATAITHGVLATLAGRLPRRVASIGRPVAVLGCGPGDVHGLGARMVGDFLEAAGWSVIDLGAATSAAAFADMAAEHRAPLVAVSSSRAEHLDGVREVRSALDRMAAPAVLAVGGHAYAGHPGRASEVGAEVHAADPREFLVQLDALGLTAPS
jgi:methanogenic corrinoid protein MtbC1